MTEKIQKCDIHGETNIKFNRLLKMNDTYICDTCVKKLHTALISKTKNKNVKIPSIEQLMTSMDKYVIGQYEAKRILAINVRNHYKRLVLNDNDIDKSNIMIFGPSGTGKTALVKAISKDLDVPMYTVDISSYSGVGYKGLEVSNIIVDFYKKVKSKTKLEQGIIFLDELDKKKKKSNTGGNDVGGELVQQELLKLIEGMEVEVDPGVYVDTSKILFVGAGAFVGMNNVINARKAEKSASIGFLSSTKKEDHEVYTDVLDEDLISYGMIPEFVGRFPVKTCTHVLTKEEIINIIKEPENSIVKQYTKLFDLDGIKLTVDDDSYDYIAEKVVENKAVGVRGIRSFFENALVDIQFDMDKIKSDGYNHILMSRKTFENNEYPKLKKFAGRKKKPVQKREKLTENLTENNEVEDKVYEEK